MNEALSNQEDDQRGALEEYHPAEQQWVEY
jgi:hypothetical protein